MEQRPLSPDFDMNRMTLDGHVDYSEWPTVHFAPNQKLPDGYRVFFDDVHYWWEHIPSGRCNGGSWDKWWVRRSAIKDFEKHANQ